MKNKSKTFLSFEESANKNWFMKPSEGKVERVLVEFADGTSYVYSTKAEIKAGDVAVISLRGKTGGEMGKILGPTTKGGGKSHLNPVQFTFATEPKWHLQFVIFLKKVLCLINSLCQCMVSIHMLFL